MNPLNGFKEILSDMIRLDLPLGPRIFPLSLPISSKNQDRLGSNLMGKFNIHPTIPDHITLGKVKSQLFHGLFDHSGCRLSTSALLTIRRDSHVRMMGPIIDSIETGSLVPS